MSVMTINPFASTPPPPPEVDYVLTDTFFSFGASSHTGLSLGDEDANRKMLVCIAADHDDGNIAMGLPSLTLDATEIPIIGVTVRPDTNFPGEKIWWGMIDWPTGTTGTIIPTFNGTNNVNVKYEGALFALYAGGGYGYVGGDRGLMQDPDRSVLGYLDMLSFGAVMHPNNVDVTWGASMTETHDVYLYNRFSTAARKSEADETFTASADPADTATSWLFSVCTLRDSAHPSMVGKSGNNINNFTSNTSPIPLDVRDNDLVIAVIMHRSALTPPAGWTLVNTTSCVGSGVTQYTSVYKRTGAASDAGVDQTWTQAASGRMITQTFVYRSTAGNLDVLASAIANQTEDTTDSNILDMAVVTANANGQAVLSAASSVLGASSGDTTMTPSAGFIQLGNDSISNNRLGVAWKPVENTEDSAGTFTTNVTPTSSNGVAAVSVLIGLAA